MGIDWEENLGHLERELAENLQTDKKRGRVAGMRGLSFRSQ
jgi:hypothetical protein